MRVPPWRAIATSLAVLAAVAGITLAVTTLLGVTFQGTGEAQQRSDFRRVEGLLSTANRDRLAICIEAVGIDSSVEITAKSAIETALVEVAKHPHWEASGLGVAAPVVDIGCPSPPAVLRPGVTVYQMGKKSAQSEPFPIVDEASYYRHFVFILPSGELERVFGKPPELTLATQEYYHAGDQAVPVTGGLYLTAADLDDTQSLAEKLKRAVGLWEPKW